MHCSAIVLVESSVPSILSVQFFLVPGMWAWHCLPQAAGWVKQMERAMPSSGKHLPENVGCLCGCTTHRWGKLWFCMLSSYRKILKTLNQFGNYIVDTKVYKLSTKLLLPQLDNAQNSVLRPSAKVNCQGSTLWPHHQYTLKYRSKVYVWILVWNHLIFRSTGQSSLFCSEQGFGYLGFLPLEPTKYEPLFWRVSLAIAKLGSATVGGVRCFHPLCALTTGETAEKTNLALCTAVVS